MQRWEEKVHTSLIDAEAGLIFQQQPFERDRLEHQIVGVPRRNYFTETCSGSEKSSFLRLICFSYLRLISFYITEL